jgi:NADH dehydrogenase
VDDLAKLAVEAVYRKDNFIWDTVGPDEFTFKEMVELIGKTIGKKNLLISVPPRLALFAAQFMSIILKDIMLTQEEVEGLMANLLISQEPPRCNTSLRKWLEENKATLGRLYASELARHY